MTLRCSITRVLLTGRTSELRHGAHRHLGKCMYLQDHMSESYDFHKVSANISLHDSVYSLGIVKVIFFFSSHKILTFYL